MDGSSPKVVRPATENSGAPRVIAFSGPKEGVGKSTITLNLALAWAGIQNRNVLIVHLDPLCRQEHSFLLNLNPPSIADLVQTVGKESISVMGRLIKGKIPMSSWGVGVLPLATKRADMQKLSPDLVLPVLASLSESYDLFLDVDPYFPMQVFAFDISDLVFWVSLPQRSHFEATINLFQEIRELHFALERFDVVINQHNLPGALHPREVEKFFQSFQKKVLAYLPWEDALPAFANTQRILVAEQAQSDWVKALRILLGRLVELKPMERQWNLSVSSAEFTQGSGLLWRSSVPVEGSGATRSSRTSSARLTENPPYWDELKQKVHKEVVHALEVQRIRISDNSDQNQELRQNVEAIADTLLQRESGLQISRDQRTRFLTELLDEILGLGPLEELMRDTAVTEIMVNAPDRVYVERGGKLTLTGYRFRDEEQIIQVIKRIVAPIGRRIDESVPLVDARLRDGSRVNAIIPPLAVSGPTLTIRRFSAKPYGPKDLIAKGSVTAEVLQFLEACVKLRKDIIISGGTGTGKTTFLNLLSSYIPGDERIITVEDTAELKLMQEHWVRLESRPANIEGKGEVTIRDLVKNCLRMRPDRIVVGECRGAEALDMLQAMNTGHEGSLATIHANTPRDALTRLEAMCLMAGADLPIWALREMICSAIHLIVQLTRFSDGSRKITAVTEIVGREENAIQANDLFRYVQTGVDGSGNVVGEYQATGTLPKFYADFGTKGIQVPKELFLNQEQKKQKTTTQW
ncbi:MAG: Flp pilus assembly complex ATPase component TadA [Elusimicrobia bacterium]|nr:Flp pilus assembly complex ATPase component TadA [Elusimicrobiota bacterium]